MSYIAVTLNHFRAVKAWVEANAADAQLDIKTFELEIKARNRYYRLLPQFLAQFDGRLAHVGSLLKESSGFIGWLPYAPPRWPLSSDKLAFKQFMVEQGLPTPAATFGPGAPAHDYLLKRSVGSFGYGLQGPFRAGQVAPAQAAPAASGSAEPGTLYGEAFVAGRNLKAWYWGDTPVYAHLQAYPAVQGDGRSTLGELIARRAGDALKDAGEAQAVQSSAAFQQLTMDTVLPAGAPAWIDYRYGRLYQAATASAASDDDLPAMDADARAQLARAGSAVAAELRRQFGAPVLYSLDGVMTGSGTIWWLEMNSNPILPPDAYPFILDSLFGVPRAGGGEATAPGSTS